MFWVNWNAPSQPHCHSHCHYHMHTEHPGCWRSSFLSRPFPTHTQRFLAISRQELMGVSALFWGFSFSVNNSSICLCSRLSQAATEDWFLLVCLLPRGFWIAVGKIGKATSSSSRGTGTVSLQTQEDNIMLVMPIWKAIIVIIKG